MGKPMFWISPVRMLMNKGECSHMLISAVQISSSLSLSLSLYPLSKYSCKNSKARLITCMYCFAPSGVKPVTSDLCLSGWYVRASLFLLALTCVRVASIPKSNTFSEPSKLVPAPIGSSSKVYSLIYRVTQVTILVM